MSRASLLIAPLALSLAASACERQGSSAQKPAPATTVVVNEPAQPTVVSQPQATAQGQPQPMQPQASPPPSGQAQAAQPQSAQPPSVQAQAPSPQSTQAQAAQPQGQLPQAAGPRGATASPSPSAGASAQGAIPSSKAAILASGGFSCGDQACRADEVCCDPQCGICARSGSVCPQNVACAAKGGGKGLQLEGVLCGNTVCSYGDLCCDGACTHDTSCGGSR